MRLKRCMYGLRDLAGVWYNLIANVLGYAKLESLKGLQYLFKKTQIRVFWFVDSLFYFTKRRWQIDGLKNKLSTLSILKGLGQPLKFLNIKPDYRVPRGRGLQQKAVIAKLLANQCMEQAKPVGTPKGLAHDFGERGVKLTAAESTNFHSILRSTLYLAMMTRQDLCMCANVLESFMERPG